MSATSPIQAFINAAKKQFLDHATRLTKAEGMITSMQQRIAQFPVQQPAPVPISSTTPQAPFVYIVSSAVASLPSPGNRVGPSDAANMFKIVGAGSPHVAVQTNNNAHHYRFIGAEIVPSAGQFATNLIPIGNADTSTSTLPNNITFDRCYIHGDPTVGGRRGVAMNGHTIAVIDSHLSDWKENGNDTQALHTYNSPGPLKIVNNYLEAAAENFMSGGADANISGLVPSDIEIRRNHIYKPLSWVGSAWQVKNLLELKIAKRVLIEGNVFENSWAAAQIGFALNSSVINQSGGSPQSTIQDLTTRYNKFINVEMGILQGGDDGYNAAVTADRILIEHNLVLIQNITGNSSYRIFQFTSPKNGPNHLTVRHNTGLVLGVNGTAAFSEMLHGKADSFTFNDNLITAGFVGTGTAEGTATLVAYYTNYALTKNAIIGSLNTGNYPAGNLFPANNAAVGFTDFAGGDYSLTSGSAYHNAASDGTDIGADFVALNAATLHGSDGQWGSEPATYSGLWTLAELPRTFIDTTYRAQNGAMILVHSGGNLQTAINNANLGDTIIVDAGATFTGTITLPAK